MEKIKIALDAQLLFEEQKTGIGWCTRMLTDHLISLPDIECTLNCFNRYDKERTKEILRGYEERGCRVRRAALCPSSVYGKLERTVHFPYRAIFGNEAEITQFFNYTVPAGVAGKSVTIIHDMVYKAYPETLERRNLSRLNNNTETYCRRAARIVTDSEFSKKEIIKYLHIPEDKIKVVCCGVDSERFHPGILRESIEETKHRYGIRGEYFLYVGTLEPRKNTETIIRAYAKLNAEKNVNAASKDAADVPALVLAGKKGWLYDSIFKQVKDDNLADRVIFTDYIPEEDVPVLMSGAKAFLFPSFYEGFGLPPLEAMACGTPVITSDAASLPEVVGDAGIMVSPEDADALARSMKMLLEDEGLRRHYSEAGKTQAAKFDWETSAEELAGLYHEILER